MDQQEFYLEKLSQHGPVVAKKMFGGVGFFMHSVIFAIIVDGKLHFRVDDQTRGDFEQLGAKQFVYVAKEREVGMPYFVVPEKILNQPPLLGKWMEKAYGAALRNRKPKPKRKKKPR